MTTENTNEHLEDNVSSLTLANFDSPKKPKRPMS
jgi:hypothetical protein